jgi:hypothetical protein
MLTPGMGRVHVCMPSKAPAWQRIAHLLPRGSRTRAGAPSVTISFTTGGWLAGVLKRATASASTAFTSSSWAAHTLLSEQRT